MSQNCYKYDHHNLFFSFTSNTTVLFITHCQQVSNLWGGGGGGGVGGDIMSKVNMCK
jgi:hypothetical protein